MNTNQDPTIYEMSLKLGVSKSVLEYRLGKLPDDIRQSMIYFDEVQTRHLTEQGVKWLESIYKAPEESQTEPPEIEKPLSVGYFQSIRAILKSLEDQLRAKDEQLQAKDEQLKAKDRQIEQLMSIIENLTPEVRERGGLLARFRK